MSGELRPTIGSYARGNNLRGKSSYYRVSTSLKASLNMASNSSARQGDTGTSTESRLFQMKDHCSDSFATMDQLRKDGQLCDIIFRIGEHRFPAHRVVLSSVSPYLKAMFTCGMRESSQGEIELRDIEPSAMAALIEYSYTGEVLVTVENVQDLLPAASILQLKDLKAACCSFLSDHMESSNCLGIKQFADLHACPDLVSKANRFIIRRFTEVVRHDEFLELPPAFLAELLGNDHLHVESERQVYSAFVRWVNHDLEGRSQYAFQLLDHIRVPLLPKEFWARAFEGEPLFQKNPQCHAFMKGYLLGVDAEESGTNPRTPIETIYAVGGRNSQRCLSSVERYVAEEDRWEELPGMRQVRTAVGAAALDGKLYAIGGECETKQSHEGTLYLTSVEYYDPIHNTWTRVADMRYPRSFTSVVVMGGKLYAIGGETTAHCYKSVEEYDPRLNQWTILPDMHIARSGAGAAALDGRLFVVGGQDRSVHHSSVEAYDPHNCSWHFCASMRHARSGVSAVVLGTYLYAIGGRDRHRQAYYDVVERYSPELNIWDTFHRLTHPRAWPAATVYKGQMYVTGGYDGQYRLKTVERFDPDEQKWKRVSDMNEYRAGCGSAVL